MSIDIFSLLPHSPDTHLKDEESKFRILYLIKFFIEEIIESITLFYIDKEYSAFDAHVGETLCQIRACLLLDLIHNSKLDHDHINGLLVKYINLNNQCHNLLDNLNKLKINKNARFNKTLDANIKLDNFLHINNFEFQIEQETLLLVQSLFLSKFSIKDVIGASQAIDYDSLHKRLNFTKSISRRIVKLYQQNLSEISSKFILNSTSQFKNLYHLKNILPYLGKIDHQKRKVFPCYEVTQVLLEILLQKKYLVLILTTRYFEDYKDTVAMLFLPTEKNFIFCNEPKEFSNQPAFIINGAAIYTKENREAKISYCQRFLDIGLEKILIANMAAHPQFSSIEFETIAYNPYSTLIDDMQQKLLSESNSDKAMQYQTDIKLATELESKLLSDKAYAIAHGCSQANPTLFLVNHIFCDLICHQYNDWEDLSYTAAPYETHSAITRKNEAELVY